jgi:Ca2+:H+ antiporter
VTVQIERRTWIVGAVAAGATLATLIVRLTHVSEVLTFGVSAVALAGLAFLVGEATDQLGGRLGPAATGVVQSALGNLPEIFISIFALQAGLVVVVQTALIGSILANSLLVLGLAMFLGGLRHGTQRFGSEQTRMMSVLLVLAVAALAVPLLATEPGAPDAGHAQDLSIVVSIVLLIVFAASIPFSVSGGPKVGPTEHPTDEAVWPLSLTLGVLGLAATVAAFVADWFVEALHPAMATLGMSEAFAGLVVVAIAGNAVENVVGVLAAMRNKMDLAISLIQNSSLQVALVVAPALVLISAIFGMTPLTLVTTPLLIGSVAVTALLVAFIVSDGESTWLEGVALVGLYVILAASVWWGPAVAR